VYKLCGGASGIAGRGAGAEESAIMIDCVCRGCGAKLKVAEEKVGRRVKCPQCNEIFEVRRARRGVETVDCPNCGHTHAPAAGGKFPVFCRECGAELRPPTDAQKVESARKLKLAVVWILLLSVFLGGSYALIRLENFAVRIVTGVVLLAAAILLIMLLNNLRK
jgi:predicted RNA-binding Zn-ribbon protein involved in translation (DUF1610 family)